MARTKQGYTKQGYIASNKKRRITMPPITTADIIDDSTDEPEHPKQSIEEAKAIADKHYEQSAIAQRTLNRQLVHAFIEEQQDDMLVAELRIAALRELAAELAKENNAETDWYKLKAMASKHRDRCTHIASICYDTRDLKKSKIEAASSEGAPCEQ